MTKGNARRSILILGATGFVGRSLTESLVSKGFTVTCLVRNVEKAKGALPAGAFLKKGNILNADDMLDASKNADIIYYLVHSIPSGEKQFEKIDLLAAENVASAAKENNVQRIIYLGGLGGKESESSAHLKSRHEVGDVLRNSGIDVTEFRAAVIAGKGGLSFEMIHHLVNRLPLMICPMWVYTKTQPIALDDVIRYLTACLDIPESKGKTIDIGGPDVLSYGEMMDITARTLGLKRYLIRVPVLTPRLSSYWVDLVTPIHSSYARTLIEGLRYETVCENDLASTLFDFQPVSFENAVEKYLGRLNTKNSLIPRLQDIEKSHLLSNQAEIGVNSSIAKLCDIISKVGGNNGWFYANWLWRFRGVIDRLTGGIGYRRGRDNNKEIKTGDRIDFWRVEKYEPQKRIRLKAEMKVWGHGWLEFETRESYNAGSYLTITAFYYPRGLFGYIYWFLTYPIHKIVFRGMAKKIARRAEES
ncbi:MAG: SDR family oxidoreductase [Candidatus Zixiibacteriota bacterium]|nr:MAG: SDR family oxidoreductase [candidate division Zixibacteria bacterium]